MSDSTGYMPRLVSALQNAFSQSAFDAPAVGALIRRVAKVFPQVVGGGSKRNSSRNRDCKNCTVYSSSSSSDSVCDRSQYDGTHSTFVVIAQNEAVLWIVHYDDTTPCLHGGRWRSRTTNVRSAWLPKVSHRVPDNFLGLATTYHIRYT